MNYGNISIVFGILMLLTIGAIASSANDNEDNDTPDWFFPLFGGLFCFILVIPIVISILIGVWMYKDANKRGENGVLWLIVGLIAGIIGLIIWLIVRPKEAPYDEHGKPLYQPYQHREFQPITPETMRTKCPQCGTTFTYQKNPSGSTRVKCPNCGKEGIVRG